MRLSLQAQYAVCGVFDLAYNGGDEPVQVRVIGDRQRIPSRYLEQIFQRLRRARIVQGKRGPGGGYTLARPPSEITLRDVIEAVEGPLDRLVARDLAGDAPARPGFLWKELADTVGAALSGIDFGTLCREASSRAIPRAHPESQMYHI
ncbi:MAG TPA: Rrf2 family transcriptional regulator [Myxococcota bacterium]|nr:Rrf2 family transcriptional regulator [Myxococcota bacterium]